MPGLTDDCGDPLHKHDIFCRTFSQDVVLSAEGVRPWSDPGSHIADDLRAARKVAMEYSESSFYPAAPEPPTVDEFLKDREIVAERLAKMINERLLLDALFASSWITSAPDTRPRWRKALDRIKVRAGRARERLAFKIAPWLDDYYDE